MQYWFKKIFGWTHREINGIVGLTILFVILSTGIHFLFSQPVSLGTLEENQLDSLKQVLQEPRVHSSKSSHQRQKKYFLPDTMDVWDWKQVGVPSKLAYRLVDYRLKGGSFNYKQQLMGVYGMTDSIYRLLEPWMSIPVRKTKVLLNQVTADELQKIGLPVYLAQRVVKYRRLLGGSYYSQEQLKEVWGIKEQHLILLREATQISVKNIHTISINNCSYQQLKKHPYLTAKEAGSIIRHRKKQGAYPSFKVLLQVKAVRKSALEKLKPYLRFDL
ncbi:helix-hairpin-helix domain-containing protein [Algivirga pacifica]|uniref:Helix-hairpin-helix domain-containing protein n=1 Tax=Algivirga pacifica TaxID=1162670 RepID=A0ABP9D694_9BACT